MGRPRAFMVGPLIRMQHFICSVHAMIGGALGGRASALPVGVIVGHVITPLPHGALLSDLSRCLDGAAHHLRWHVLLGIGAGGCRDTVSAKLEWKLVLGATRWSALSSSGSSGRIGVAILVVHILLRGRLGSLLLAGRLGLGWGQLLLLGLPLPRAVRHAVHLPFVPLGGRAVRAIHWPFVILLLLLIHCGLLAGEGAAGRGALSGELIAIGIMSLLLLLLLRGVAAGRIHPRVWVGRHEIRLWGSSAHVSLGSYSRLRPHSVIRTSIGIVLSRSHRHISQPRAGSSAVGVSHSAIGALP